jgi:hypothetical protein
MNRHILLVLFAGALFLAGNVGAKEISLDMGETYRQGILTVTCGQPLTVDKPLALNDCQHGISLIAPATIGQNALSSRPRSYLCKPPAISLTISTIPV